MSKKSTLFTFVLIIIVLAALLYFKEVIIGSINRILEPTANNLLSPFSQIPVILYLPAPPTIEAIFQDDHLWTATLSAKLIRTIVVTGDVIPARSVNYRTVLLNNFHWPFEYIADKLKNSDITFVNLESPLIAGCPLTNSGMIFCSDERHIDGLRFAGIDVVSLANNHISNYGKAGIESTIKSLEEVNVLPVGLGMPVYKDIRGLRFAFLAFNDIGDSIDPIDTANKEKIYLQISQAKKINNVVIIAFHWGIEYTDQPSSRQKELAHFAIDTGADLVVGNHPHWIQPIEIYNNKVIIYAHGNLVFDQMWSEKTREGVIGRYTFYDKKLIDVEFTPIIIYDFGQPRLADEVSKKRILDGMREGSIKLSFK